MKRQVGKWKKCVALSMIVTIISKKLNHCLSLRHEHDNTMTKLSLPKPASTVLETFFMSSNKVSICVAPLVSMEKRKKNDPFSANLPGDCALAKRRADFWVTFVDTFAAAASDMKH